MLYLSQEIMDENRKEVEGLLGSVKREGIDKLLKFLDESDFYVAPASTRFHGNYDGALVEHVLNVYQLLLDKNTIFKLGLSQETIIITTILHDMCKVNNYKKAIKSVKDNNTGKWRNYNGYDTNDILPLGHGEKSLYMINKFIDLTDQEALMIRWHMGGFEPESNYKYMNKAYEMEKAAVALHTSDMEASNILEITMEV